MKPKNQKRIARIEMIAAMELGKLARRSGISAAPCLDKKVMDMLSGRKVGTSIHILKAWHKGWTSENLKIN